MGIRSYHALEVLIHLTKGGSSFTEIVFALDMHPQIVSSSLEDLINLKLVTKRDGRYYLTGRGVKFAQKMKVIYEELFQQNVECII